MKRFIIATTFAFAGMVLVADRTAFAQEANIADQADMIVVYSDADAQAVLDARIAALKTVLKLTTEQEVLWPPVEAAIQKITADSIARGKQRSEAQPPEDFLDVLRRVAEAEATRAADLGRFVNETAPLVTALSDEQKNRVPAFLGMFADPAAPLSTNSLWLFEEEER